VRAARSAHDSASGHAQVRPQGPTALRIVLGNQLRQLREARGITTGMAGHVIRASHAKISRMELGRVGFKERDVADLLTLYGITDEQERGAFLALARRSNVPGWWHHYNDILPNWFEMYLGLEQASSVIRTYEPQLIPGLLQTEGCARAVMRLAYSNTEDIERRVSLRMQRQKFLTQPGAPSLWAVIDEAVLWRIDGRSTMRDQIRHLIEVADFPNITLQVMPFYSGAHVAVGGSFSILRFSEPDLPDIVYLEQLTSSLYLDKEEDVQRYLVVMDRLCVQAKPPAETIRFLNSTLKEI
jgi:hypothetical protein